MEHKYTSNKESRARKLRKVIGWAEDVHIAVRKELEVKTSRVKQGRKVYVSDSKRVVCKG